MPHLGDNNNNNSNSSNNIIPNTNPLNLQLFNPNTFTVLFWKGRAIDHKQTSNTTTTTTTITDEG